MIVVDASAVLEVLLQTRAAQGIAARLFAADSLHAPHLLDVEVAQVLRRYEARNELSAARGVEALADLAAFPLTRYPHDVLLPRIWELRANLTAYDAAYIALAEALRATVITRDERLAAAPGHRARVEVVG
jgi:predicted nucleic acid-binding protein